MQYLQVPSVITQPETVIPLENFGKTDGTHQFTIRLTYTQSPPLS
jgi:hypothetical protein